MTKKKPNNTNNNKYLKEIYCLPFISLLKKVCEKMQKNTLHALTKKKAKIKKYFA